MNRVETVGGKNNSFDFLKFEFQRKKEESWSVVVVVVRSFALLYRSLACFFFTMLLSDEGWSI